MPQSSQLARPKGLAGLRYRALEQVRKALDLPSRSELSAAVQQLDDVQARLDAVERKADDSIGQVAELRENSASEQTRTRERVKRLKKELKKNRSTGSSKKKSKSKAKPKSSKAKTTIDVASPKTVKERKSKSPKAKG